VKLMGVQMYEKEKGRLKGLCVVFVGSKLYQSWGSVPTFVGFGIGRGEVREE